MVYDQCLVGEKIYLRTIEPTDCNSTYLAWMQDEETNRYMETRWVEQTLEIISDFVDNIRASKDSILFAIIEKGTEKHIGNIKIGPINSYNHWADISYFIGDKSARGKGYAKEAVKLICHFGFSKLHLHRLQAGLIEGNLGSEHTLRQNGFQYEGRLAEKCFLTSTETYADHLLFGLLNPDHS